MPSRQLRVPKASELIAADLRERIVRGELSEGEGLPSEGALMAEFSVSRPTLREAHRILESEGLLSMRRGAHGGATVHRPRAEFAARYAALVLQSRGVLLSDVYEARLMVEGSAAGVLAARRTRDGVPELHALINEAAACGDRLVPLLASHHRFHKALIELVGNETFTLVTGMMDNILSLADLRHVEARQSDESELRSLRRAQRTHVKVVELIEANDVVAADKLWRKHLADAAALVLSGSQNTVPLDVLPAANTRIS